MADSASLPATLQSNPQYPESGAPVFHHNQSDPVPASTPPATQLHSFAPSSAPVNPNSISPLVSAPPPPPPTITYAAAAVPPVSGGAFAPPAVPSFRPLPPQTPQFSPLPSPGGVPNLNYQNNAVQPPGVSSASAMTPGVAGGTGAVPVSVPQMQPVMSYQIPPGQPPNPVLRLYSSMPNGYAAIPASPQGTMPPPVS